MSATDPLTAVCSCQYEPNALIAYVETPRKDWLSKLLVFKQGTDAVRGGLNGLGTLVDSSGLKRGLGSVSESIHRSRSLLQSVVPRPASARSEANAPAEAPSNTAAAHAGSPLSRHAASGWPRSSIGTHSSSTAVSGERPEISAILTLAADEDGVASPSIRLELRVASDSPSPEVDTCPPGYYASRFPRILGSLFSHGPAAEVSQASADNPSQQHSANVASSVQQQAVQALSALGAVQSGHSTSDACVPADDIAHAADTTAVREDAVNLGESSADKADGAATTDTEDSSGVVPVSAQVLHMAPLIGTVASLGSGAASWFSMLGRAVPPPPQPVSAKGEAEEEAHQSSLPRPAMGEDIIPPSMCDSSEGATTSRPQQDSQLHNLPGSVPMNADEAELQAGLEVANRLRSAIANLVQVCMRQSCSSSCFCLDLHATFLASDSL